MSVYRRSPRASCRSGSVGRARRRGSARAVFGDGYIPMGLPKEQYPEAIGIMREAAAAAGRPEDFRSMSATDPVGVHPW